LQLSLSLLVETNQLRLPLRQKLLLRKLLNLLRKTLLAVLTLLLLTQLLPKLLLKLNSHWLTEIETCRSKTYRFFVSYNRKIKLIVVAHYQFYFLPILFFNPFYNSQANALAPRTAASAFFKLETSSLALPLYMLRMFSS